MKPLSIRCPAVTALRQSRKDLRKLSIDVVEAVIVTGETGVDSVEARIDGVKSRVVRDEARVDGVESCVVGGEARVDLVEAAVVADNFRLQIQDHVTDDLDLYLQAVNPGVGVWHVITVAAAACGSGVAASDHVPSIF